MTKQRAIGGLLMHFVGPGCLDAVCGLQPKRGWAAPERDRYWRNCRACVRLYIASVVQSQGGHS